MLAGSALQSGVNLQPEASRRGWLRAPGRDDEEFFSDQQRRPGLFGARDPIDIGRDLRIAERARSLRVVEIRVDKTRPFDDAERAPVPPCGSQTLSLRRHGG